MRRRATIAAALAAVLTLPALALPASSGAETVTLPGDAATGTQRNDLLYQVACPAAGDCVGVGAYNDTSGNHQALIESESDGNWVSSNIPDSSLPNEGPPTPPVPYLTSVACTSVGNCVAADAYDDSSDREQGLIDGETDGSWTPIEAPLTGLAVNSTNPGVEVYDVACPAAGACVGLASYDDTGDSGEAMFETQSQAGWTPTEAPWPSGSMNTTYEPTLYDLACASAGNCAAVGSYTDGSGNQQGLLDTDADGVWTASELDLSSLGPGSLSPAANPQATAYAVSCPAAGDCTAVGIYATSSGAYAAFVVTSLDGQWQAASPLALPGDAATSTVGQNDLYLNGVSCASVGDCTAVGSYDATSANDVEPLSLTETGGAWGSGTETDLPDGTSGPSAASNPHAALDSITCQSAADCLAAGTYVDGAGDNVALLARQSAEGWSSAGADLTTSYDTSLANQYWASVACAADGYCATGGYAADTSTGLDGAFLLDAPAAPTDIAAALSGTQAATVSWSAPSDDGGLPVTGYAVTASDLSNPQAGGQSSSAAAAGTSATVDGLAPGDTYTFTVSATSLLGTGVPATSNSVPVPASTTTSTTPTSTTPTTTTPTVTTPTTTTPSQTKPSPVASPSRVQIAASLGGLLKPVAGAARLSRLRRTHGYLFRYQPLEPGRVSARWYYTTVSGHRRHRTLVAAGTANAAAHALKLDVQLTSAGRLLVRTHRRLRLASVVEFTGPGVTVSRSAGFSLS